MASADWQKNVLCRYFAMGSCHRGEECQYSHDRTVSNRGTLPCRFFQSGTCANGDSCKFSHGAAALQGVGEALDDQVLSLQLASSLVLDPCQDPNCPEEMNPAPGPDPYVGGGAGAAAAAIFPASPTYIVYTPAAVFHSPAISPAHICLSPVHSLPDPCTGAYSGDGLSPYASPPHPTHPPTSSMLTYSADIAATATAEMSPYSCAVVDPSSSYVAASSTTNINELYQQPDPAVTTNSGGLLYTPQQQAGDIRTALSTATSKTTNQIREDAPVFVPRTSAASSSQRWDPPQMVELSRSSRRHWNAPANWADAPEFVPKAVEQKPRSWAQVVNSGLTYPGCELTVSEAESNLCPYFRVGECRYGAGCAYIHGEICDYCGNSCLHPTHLDQRRSHLAECLREHERDMELSFAVARSREKTCGICMETVLDKPKGEARFGILPSCTHCFCLPCIRKWRQAKQFEHKIIRACPECRQTSDFICPSRFWVETPEEKERLLTEYKKNLGLKECKYFNKGAGECPFGNKCFYKHADKDGRTVDVGPPKKPVRRTNADGSLSLVQRLLLYDFLEERDGQIVLPMDFMELFDLYSDSDEWSEGDDQ